MTGQQGAEWSIKFMKSGGVSLLVELVLEVDLCDEPTSADTNISTSKTGMHAATVLLTDYNMVVHSNTSLCIVGICARSGVFLYATTTS
jgi:hypothetical protein